MKNKIAVVTNGTIGLGTEICQHLFTHDARVIATYHRMKDHIAAKTWQNEQRHLGYDIDILHIDAAHFPMCKDAIEEIEKNYNAIDILVNHVNNDPVETIFNITHSVMVGMMTRFYGRIINVSSNLEVHQFTKSLAEKVARRGITVNTVSPGYIENVTDASISESVREKLIASIPAGRLGRPEEIARAIGFFAAQASSFITGSNLLINGGQTL